MKKTSKEQKTVKKKNTCYYYYMADREIGASAIYEVIKTMDDINEMTEFWDAADVIEIATNEKDTIDIEKIPLFKGEKDKEFLESNGIKSIFSITCEADDVALLKKIFAKVKEANGGNVCSDTEDFKPFIV
ncbi:MAG: hypothetical protein K6G26_14085 [Lachnospiraceae bacterium]|nr:hypothetical protein [Lachnospiraceae bacterium]